MDLYVKHKKEESSIDVTVRSWLNYDGFECNGKTDKLDEIDKLREEIEDYGMVCWHKGKNTFTGKIISDKFFVDMVSRVEGI